MLKRTSILTARRISVWVTAVHKMHVRAKKDGTNDFLNFVDLVANEAILEARIPECEVSYREWCREAGRMHGCPKKLDLCRDKIVNQPHPTKCRQLADNCFASAGTSADSSAAVQNRGGQDTIP